MSNRPASLTSALMARKGAAGPSHLELAEAAEEETRQAGPKLVPPAARPHKAKPRKQNGEADDGKRRFTLRLSEDQHLRMRLASVHLHMSAQQMVMKALDQYLANTAPEIRSGGCACMAGENDDATGKPAASRADT